MKKIKLRQLPRCVDIAMIVILILIFFVLITTNSNKPDRLDLIVLIGAAVLFFVSIICCSVVRTSVRFGDGSIIRCRWLFLFWKIDLEKINAVTYKLTSFDARGGGTGYFFNMMFYYKGEKHYLLKDRLDSVTAERCIRREYDYVQLMELYRYIKEKYPEKAKGYE